MVEIPYFDFKVLAARGELELGGMVVQRVDGARLVFLIGVLDPFR